MGLLSEAQSLLFNPLFKGSKRGHSTRPTRVAIGAFPFFPRPRCFVLKSHLSWGERYGSTAGFSRGPGGCANNASRWCVQMLCILSLLLLGVFPLFLFILPSYAVGLTRPVGFRGTTRDTIVSYHPWASGLVRSVEDGRWRTPRSRSSERKMADSFIA